LAGEVMGIDVSDVHTLLERYAEEVGGTFVARVFGQTRVYLVDIDQASPALPFNSFIIDFLLITLTCKLRTM